MRRATLFTHATLPHAPVGPVWYDS